MSKYKKVSIIDIDGQVRDEPDFPVAVLREYPKNEDDTHIYESYVVDAILTHQATNNLHGRIMTLVEATTDPKRLKAVKDVFSKELRSWENHVNDSARQLATGDSIAGNSIYN